MAKNFKDLIAKMPPERQARIRARAEQLLAEMPLDELRKAREMTQELLAKTLQINQAAVSKLEHRADMYLSSLRKFIEAMGGTLDIRAVFPEGVVRINLLGDLARRAKSPRKPKRRRAA